ncbi:unnamed protein product [Arctia plantaginis]|uniref:DRBM domain-containing protein n=1 Tax=Arctia plantaginis TaxID=874455 RepID=A0A8S0Z6G4_ARCPL|nr:unnamed protein product [Arctia plantaginis]CAB3261883.1 unnamed protein product [Arctia plantaginis]
MAYNKQYNNRFPSRYNTPGHFVSGGELAGPPAPRGGYTPRLTPPFVRPSAPFSQPPHKPMPNNVQPSPPQEEDMPMDQEAMSQSLTSDDSSRPYWMKPRLPGVKKISNKERRRRQNENLRRLLTPKNALMVLNEMMPNEQVTNQFKVEPAQYNTFKPPNTHTFCADLTIDGNVYQGYGDNKLMARNAAAEQAIRDLIIKKMNKALTANSDSGSTTGAGAAGSDEEALPMIQLASFALHKLFTEWEYEGHSVPQLKPANHSAVSESASEAAAPPPRKAKELPAGARSLHPCMLLTHMRPNLEYREVAAGTERTLTALKYVFTMSVEVDGVTYVGKGANKKEARKNAAKAACKAIFDVTFDEDIVEQD